MHQVPAKICSPFIAVKCIIQQCLSSFNAISHLLTVFHRLTSVTALCFWLLCYAGSQGSLANSLGHDSAEDCSLGVHLNS